MVVQYTLMGYVLNLGVIEKPYTHGGKTTGDIATILEKKYKVMETFYEHHEEEILHAFKDSYEGALETLLMGGSVHGFEPSSEGASKVEQLFRTALETKEFDSYGIPGVPTKTSLRGVSHRFKRKKNQQGSRPSFIDTGAYENSFKAWITENAG
jgi:hypothetical protein